MQTVIKGLTDGVVYGAHVRSKVEPWIERAEKIPFAPAVSGTVAAGGTLTIDIPENVEHVLQEASSPYRHVHVLNATTVVTSA